MATYDSLTQEQKDDIATYDNKLRGIVSSLHTLVRDTDPDTANQFAIDNVDPVVATLDAGEVIPNSTGLGGAKDLTKEEFLDLQTTIRSFFSTLKTKKSKTVKAVGVNAR